MLDTPLERQTLSDQLTKRLTELITTQGLKSGDELPSEGELSARFGVSRAVTREALRVLQERGIVAIANGKRATVKPLTSEPLRNFFHWAVSFEQQSLVELLEVRKGLEVQAATLAAQRRTPDDVAALRDTLARLEAAVHDATTYTGLDATLHRQIAAAARNEMLQHLIVSLHEPFMQQLVASLRGRHAEAQPRKRGPGPDRLWRQALNVEHERIVDAIARGDAEAAAATIAAHLESARMVIARDPYQEANADEVPRAP
jgi:GntR family transcriptional repressor for pyruvate dehydrogenase complex